MYRSRIGVVVGPAACQITDDSAHGNVPVTGHVCLVNHSVVCDCDCDYKYEHMHVRLQLFINNGIWY